MILGRLAKIYADGRWVSGYRYLDASKRAEILRPLKTTVTNHGMRFAVCREGLPHLGNIICDGTAYCREPVESPEEV